MSSVNLKSYQFRLEREKTWRELAVLVGRAEAGGIKSLTPDELFRLPSLYRATVSSLSVARSISLDQNVILYLESLAARAYFIVYGGHGSLSDGVAAFFSSRFPQAVRAAKWHILAAAFFLFMGIVTGLFVTLDNMEWYYTFVPAELAGDRSPTSTRAELEAALFDYGGGFAEALVTFSTSLFTHNARIGMLAFALGFALGVPVIVLMFKNGLTIGAFAALYANQGLSVELWGWLSIHGTTELLAIVLCGAAGLILGGSVAFPGRYGRLENLARNGRLASQIVIGAVGLFFVAGLLEGVGRQVIVDTTLRYLIAFGALILWAHYFLRVGKDRFDGDDG